MLYLNFAPSADLLARIMLQKVRYVWKDPFSPPTVIVPNPAVGKWLQMQMVLAGEGNSSLGCLANIRLQTLEKYLWGTLQPDSNMRLLMVDQFSQVICALLDPKLLEEECYRPLREYLGTESGEIDPLKRVQFSIRIAQQFLEYEYNRPSVWDERRGEWCRLGIDASWIRNHFYFRDAAHEEWQKDLYCRALSCFGQSDSGENRFISLPRLYRRRREEKNQRWCEPDPSIFIFGVSKVSHFHRNILVEISQMENCEMQLFLTNPCAEFWEDVNTSRSRGIRRKWNYKSDRQSAGITPMPSEGYDKEELSDVFEIPPDHTLLELWGGAGKENIALWCPQAQWNFEYHSPLGVQKSSTFDTLLGAVKYSLLQRQSALVRLNAEKWKGDGSLRILACSDRSREVEEIREQILDLVHERIIDKLNEVVVYLPDPGKYVPYIERVFGAFKPGESQYIPFTILGTPGSASVFSQGMKVFIEILRGSFNRGHVFEFLRNPIVELSLKISADQVRVWEKWARELGIFRGYNRFHREKIGDRGEAATDAHTFELGMARMLMGNLAAGPVELDYTLYYENDSRLPVPIPPYRDFETSDADLLNSFCFTIDKLYEDLQHFFSADDMLEIDSAVKNISDIVWFWFGQITDDLGYSAAAEARVRREFLEYVDLLKLQKEKTGRERIPVEEFLSHIEACLPGELSGVSTAWTGGITFAPLRPSMVLPHKVVLVLGLESSAFPGTNEKAGWDLLSIRRIIGDSDQVRDNRFAFLELLHAAQERLLLSYRARDMQKDEDLQPASVVLELEDYLEEQGVDIHATGIHRSVPWVIHESLEEIRACGRTHGSWDGVQLRLAAESAKERALHRHQLAMKNAASKPVIEPVTEYRTSIYEIRKFFSNPLEYHLYVTLGIDLSEQSDIMGITDEPLESGNLAFANMQNEIVSALLFLVFPQNREDEISDPNTLSNEITKLAEKTYNEHLVSGGAPEGSLCRMERCQLFDWARQCAGKTLELKALFPDHTVFEKCDLSLQREKVPAVLQLRDSQENMFRVECRHKVVFVPRDSAESNRIGILDISSKGNAKDNHDLWLSGVVQHLAEKNTNGSQPVQELELVQLNRKDLKISSFSLNMGEKEKEIYDWFCHLLSSMLIQRSCEHLPFRVIQEITKQSRKKPAEFYVRLSRVTTKRINEILSADFSPYTSYLKAFELTDAQIPDMEDSELQELVKKRFAPVLEGWGCE
ncbi:MAG: exodeoxyribonuclease V subunit gamma [Chitinispirillaceae bacterium]